jgi:hypothetical protein
VGPFGVLGGTYSQYLELIVLWKQKSVFKVDIKTRPNQQKDRMNYMANAIKFRDSLISQLCADLKVNTSIDLGCDFGSLIAHQLMFGVTKPKGIDINPAAIQQGKKNLLDVDLKDLSDFMGDDKKYECITSLNITQKKWDVDKRRFDLIKNMLSKTKTVCVVTLFDEDLKKLDLNLSEWEIYRLGNRTKFTQRDEIKLMYSWKFGRKLPFFYQNIKESLLNVKFEDFVSSYVNLPVVFIRKQNKKF